MTKNPGKKTDKSVKLEFLRLQEDRDDSLAILSLNRPDFANAFNGKMIEDLRQAIAEIRMNPVCRAVILSGTGNNFCAGADLTWMKDSASLNYRQNIADAENMAAMFEDLYNLPIPLIAVVKGAVFAGAIGLMACADITIAAEDTRFCLSEVKIGIIPAVILPYVARKMRWGQLRRLSLNGTVFGAKDALEYGLVEIVSPENELRLAVREEVEAILSASSEAQTSLKALYRKLIENDFRQGSYTVEAIGMARTSRAGQDGLASFLEKKPMPWKLTLDKDWSLDGF